MFGVVREFQPPLGVTHAVRGKFGPTSSPLGTVFARKNSLDLYVVRANLESARLEHLSSTFLGSTIVSLAVVRRPSSSSDLILVGFEHMRIAVLSWQPDRFSFVTEQLLDLGKLLGTGSCSADGITSGLDSKCKWRPLLRGSSGSESDPVIRPDPSGRCVAILSKAHGIFYVLTVRSEEDSTIDSGNAINTSLIFVVDLRSEYDIANVKDFTFLHGMFEPHICILNETKRTWSGRTAVQRNTCSLLTISIDLRSKCTSSSWSMDQLPYDCDKLEAVPDSARGGVLVLSSSVVMQVRHGSCVAGLSLNCYGDAYAAELRSKYETIIQSDTLVECDAAHCRFLDVEETLGAPTQSIALLSLKGGELYFLHVAVNSQNTITMKRAGSTVIASEIIPINERFYILSSRLSDSLLVEYKRVQEDAPISSVEKVGTVSNVVYSDGKSIPESASKEKRTKSKKRKRTDQEDDEYEMIYGVKPPPKTEDDSDGSSDDQERTLDLNENDDQGTRGVYDDDDELGFVFKSDVASRHQQKAGNWALTVKDTVPCFGPGADITMGPSPKDVSQSKLDLVVAGGYAKNGCLAVIHQFIRPSTFTEFPMPGCEGVWTLIDPSKFRQMQKERAERNLDIMTRNKALRLRNVKAKESRREYLQKAVATLKEEEIDKEEVVRLRHEIDVKIPLEEEESIENPLEGEEGFHSYMLLSTSNSTVVLGTDSDLEEVMPDATDFVTSEETIVAGNVLKNRAIVQVVPSKVRVIMDGAFQCEFKIDEGQKVRKAQVSDPLILLHTDKNQLIVLRLDAEPFNISEPDPNDDEGSGDEFDEYGMPTSKLILQSDRKASELDSNSNKGKQSTQSFRNFSLEVDFKLDCTSGDVDVSASFLYKGPLASEIAEDGILSYDEKSHTESAEAQNGSLEKLKANSTEELNEKSLGGHLEEKQEAPLDDEDRMLYDEEEDKLLYGAMEEGTEIGNGDDIDKSATEQNGEVSGKADQITLYTEINIKKKSNASERGVTYLDESPATEIYGHLLIICNANGGLQILSKELQYSTVLDCPYLYTAPNNVSDISSSDSKKEKDTDECPAAIGDYKIDGVIMTEVTASSHLPGFSTPFLIFTSHSGLPVVYRAFMKPKSQIHGHSRSRLGFKRVTFRDGTTRWLSRLMKKPASVRQMGNSKELGGIHPTVFGNISGRSGVFLGGDCPAFLFAERGFPRIHELTHSTQMGETVSRETFEDGQGVISFAEFHNMSCPRGFAYVGDDNVIRIGALSESKEMNYDAPTPFRKVALRCTPHKVAYHGGSATYGVLASMPTLTTREERLARILQSLEKHDKRHYQHSAAQAEAETGDEHGDRVPPLFEELHELRVYRPDNWNLIRSHKLQKGEVGLAIMNMKVNVYKQQMAGPGVEIPSSRKGDDGNESLFAASLKMRPKDVLVVGTGYLNGEDASSRGRLLLFEISRQEVYTEAGGMYTAFQLQLIAEKELLSPVTAVAAMEGYVIAGVGPLVSVYKLVGDEIVHLSFAFGQLYCSSIATLKQYVVAADMCKSISFMYFRERNNSVNFLGQDYETVTCYATEFLIENDKMSLVVSDERGNIRLLNFVHASIAASRGGKRLLLNGGIHIGSRVNKFVRVRMPDRKALLNSGEATWNAGNHALMFATLDGGIGALVGVEEEEFRWMEKTWGVVNEFAGTRRCGGVNMKEVSGLRHGRAGTEMLDQRLLDSRCIYDVFEMSVLEMSAVSRLCGVKTCEFARRLLALDSVMWRY